MTIEIRPENNLASVSRELYSERYARVRRPDGSQLWAESSGLACVLARGCAESQINHTKLANRRVYLLKEDAVTYADKYIMSRINSNGRTKLTLAEVLENDDCNSIPAPKFGRIARMLGIHHLWDVGRDISCQLLRLQETMNEVKRIWQ